MIMVLWRLIVALTDTLVSNFRGKQSHKPACCSKTQLLLKTQFQGTFEPIVLFHKL